GHGNIPRTTGPQMKSMHIAIVFPVFEDWDSLVNLIHDIDEVLADDYLRVRLIVVDDGSTSPVDLDSIELPSRSSIEAIEIIHLGANLGHQRGIAVGLCEACAHVGIDAVVTMDSDGEDKGSHVRTLLSAHRANPDKIVAAARTKRSEPSSFKLGYYLYRVCFRAFTGYRINFGNFCLFPMAAVRRLVFMPELWNNLPGCVIHSRI